VHASPTGSTPESTPEITYDIFRQVDIRVGTIVAVDPFPEARRPAFKLTITQHYVADQLIGRQVAAVVNFPKKQIGRFMSEVLVLGFPDANGEVVLIAPSQAVPNGGRLF
jgi:tRNA-binding protein